MRALRGSLLAASSAALASTAHAAADGGLPDASGTVVLTALIGWTATSLADKVRGPLGILAMLGAAQLLMHLVLTALNTHPGAGNHVDPIAMTSAHVVATLLTAVLLAHAERGLLLATAALRRLLPVLWSPPVPSVPISTVVHPAAAGARAVDVLLRRVCARRGPPVHS